MAGVTVDELKLVIEGLRKRQRDALRAAKSDSDGWHLNIRHPGFRGLPTRGIAYGRAKATRAPGAFGLLTAYGNAVREHLLTMPTD